MSNEKTSSLPIELPEIGRPVGAVLKRYNGWTTTVMVLVRVDEPDEDFRTHPANNSIAHEWNVIYWEYLD